MIYLATTSQRDLWRTDIPVVCLGPWCVLGQAAGDETQALSVAQSPWKHKDYQGGVQTCESTLERTLAWLGPALNELHGLDQSQRYWSTFLDSWLFYFIQLVYDRYIHIKAILESYSDVVSIGVAPTFRYAQLPSNSSLLAELANDDWYNLSLYSGVLDTLHVPGERIVLPDDRALLPRSPSIPSGPFKRMLRKTVGRLTDSNPVLVCGPGAGAPREYLVDMLVRRKIKFVGDSTDFVSHVTPNLEQRNRLRGSESTIEFPRLVDALLPQYLPSTFVERLDSVISTSRKKYGLPNHHILTWAEWGRSESFDCHAAECAEVGKKLVSVQHGAGYGHFACSPSEYIEVGRRDKFLTWGWESKAAPDKTAPFADRRLSRFRDTYVGGEGKALYLSTMLLRYPYRLHSAPSPHEMPNYIQSGFDFLRALDSEVYNSVQCKPYFTDYGWGYEERLRRAGLSPTTANWEKRNAAELLPLVRFVVVDHPGTSLLESLVINTPTILFWNPEHWRMRDEAKPFFDLLRSVNILHDSPLDAAGHCETIFEDPMKWWMSRLVQEAREAFIDTYALTSADWATEWRTMIDSLVDGSLFDDQKAQSLQVSHV